MLLVLHEQKIPLNIEIVNEYDKFKFYAENNIYIDDVIA